MNNYCIEKISKYLSLVLKHSPDKIGIKLDANGWVSIEELLKASQNYNFPITQIELNEVVEKNDKKRFSLDSTKTLIRANQGHSLTVDLQLEARTPPDMLYHGTGNHLIGLIKQTGLQKMSRHHVHLSQDINTARNVGKRKGKAVVFAVDASAMYKDDYVSISVRLLRKQLLAVSCQQ
ncbi:MAG: RNA 2'-phosphotransferase [Cyanobacteriota bacterium]|nr:RNA 2'-phosphotransferase [Cyanobacteriota bacterium]